MFETMIVELTEEARVTRVTKVTLAGCLFKNGGVENLEGSSVGHPRNAITVGSILQHVMDLLGKGHVVNVTAVVVAGVVIWVGRDQ